jgi:Ca-activated chloride channel family protein
MTELVMFLFLLMIPCSSYSFDIVGDFIGEKGNSNYKKEDYTKAYDYYKKALEKDLKNDKLKFNLANSLYKLEKYDEAEKYYKEIKNKKVVSKSLYNLGNTYMMKNDDNSAIKYYKEAILADPKNNDAKYNLELLLKKKASSSSKDNKDKKNDSNKDKDQNNNSGKGNDKEDKNQQDNNEQEKKEQEKKERQKQAEQFLDMIKNQEKQNMKNIQSKPQHNGGYKNEYDW